MTIRVALHHRTRYDYERPIVVGPQTIRLKPAAHCRTPICSYSLQIQPEGHFLHWQQDPHGNHQARATFPDKTDHLEFLVEVIAEMTVINPFDFFLEPYAEEFPFEYERGLKVELGPFLETEPQGPLFQEYLASIDRRPQHIVDFLVALNQQLEKEIRYLIRMEPGVQSPEETLAKKSGSCRDSAWLLVHLLRNIGLAARFTSGYLIQLAPDVKSLDGPSGPEQDFTDLHAWCEVFVPGAGWIGLDPTSGLFAGEGHIPLACTPRPESAAPISGGIEKCESQFEFEMQVSRIHEDPRVTRPYTEPQWQRVLALGDVVDAALQQHDVRLTMGGEPTFVSIDDMEGAEWNSAAVGPTKRRISGQLIRRLRERFSNGGLLHFGQGKWYPGESLPRWQMACYWRKDGHPIWRDDSLLAEEHVDYGFKDSHAKLFTRQLAETLRVESRWVVPAFEDVAHYLWKERRLPVNIDPTDPKLADPEERERLSRVFERGLHNPCGFVLPLQRQWWQGKARWISGPWPFRSERMYLLPGDSPIGLRLPLDSLPYLDEADRPLIYPRDPFESRPPLADPAELARQLRIDGAPDRIDPPGVAEQEPIHQAIPGDESRPPVRTALCVEPREGRLYVFMPPVEAIEDYLELVHAIEDTATRLKMPVILEGYLPPYDARVDHIKVTPDPGVIEVNIHPAHSWEQLVDTTEAIYDEARHCRLGTEKFDLDGKHSGTGGGNHVVMGGPTPADSPFLRRPDLLKSMVAYWNNHPSLSYLFSGRFIGPTSQAPRVDEGRQDALYELQMALDLVGPPDQPCQPWLTDRLFRNLLVDLTGNTHRAEFCIDKLYSPDSSSGRLGLLELRALEMPPHARMSITQQLLVRALVAMFWQKPYEQRLVEWGTTLHDRFLLPWFVKKDFEDIVAELNRFGFAFEADWFAPHLEFRFPLIGEFEVGPIHIELRTAIEPWNVLGEEPGGGGTVRYVDSSVERLQVHVEGLTDGRHVLSCNGRRLPMHQTGHAGEAVAGVRYRAWQPPSCLHPTIPVHAPLVFDVYDQWNERSIGGCTYHVAHPGGRNYDTFPVNAFEAESRRIARFFVWGHTPGNTPPPRMEENQDFPLTLDLRKTPRYRMS